MIRVSHVRGVGWDSMEKLRVGSERGSEHQGEKGRRARNRADSWGPEDHLQAGPTTTSATPSEPISLTLNYFG